LFFYKNILVPI